MAIKVTHKYSQSAVDDFINEALIPQGYVIEELDDVLVTGYVCYAPSDEWKLVIFLPVYLNEWSSALELHQYRDWTTVPKWMKETIERYREEA